MTTSRHLDARVRSVVVKIGGGEGIDPGLALADVASLVKAGTRVIVVHGGSHAATDLGIRLGVPPRFVTSPSGRSSRYTDEDTMKLFTMAVRGGVNADVVERLQAAGIGAVGLSGIDGRLVSGRRKSTVKNVEGGKIKLLRGDHSGTVDAVNVHLLDLLLGGGYVPVVGPPGWSDDGRAVNVDADRVAAAVATAIAADALIFLTNVPGVLADPRDHDTLVPRIVAGTHGDQPDVALGRMRTKVDAARQAVASGVRLVVIASCNVPTPVTGALGGAGTIVSAPPCEDGTTDDLPEVS